MDQKKKRRRRKHFLDTDYDIPKFNFKQAILIMLAMSLVLIVGSILVETVPSQFALFVMILVSVGVGFTISGIQFYKKEDARRSIFLVGGLFSTLAFIMLFALYYSDILI